MNWYIYFFTSPSGQMFSRYIFAADRIAALNEGHRCFADKARGGQWRDHIVLLSGAN